MPALRLHKAIRVLRGVRLSFDLKISASRGKPRGGGASEKDWERRLETLKYQVARQRRKLSEKDREISRLRAALPVGERRKAPEAPDSGGEKAAGRFPDFLIIGAQKSGTSFLYSMLSQHPHVDPAARKEINYFNDYFQSGPGWYASHFPAPSRGEGYDTITGEASPHYLSHEDAAGRVAEAVPGARLILLLRNPVDRTYSHYQARRRRGGEVLSFEDAIEADMRLMQKGEIQRRTSYLGRSIYVDQIQRWRKFFGEDQMLIIQSEDFFARTPEVLERVVAFLGLPPWKFELSSTRGRNKGSYDEPMSPGIRRRLEEYFEPHNRRLYEYLGVDFGW